MTKIIYAKSGECELLLASHQTAKKKEEGRKKRGCCSRVKMMSACENVTFESGRLCDRRAEDVGSPFSSSDEKKEKKKRQVLLL